MGFRWNPGDGEGGEGLSAEALLAEKLKAWIASGFFNLMFSALRRKVASAETLL